VWKEGMEDWLKASEFSELSDLFQKEPPPIPEAKTKAKTENAPPPIPEEKPKETKDSNNTATKKILENVTQHALSIAVLLMGTAIMEYKELQVNKFYGFLVMALLISTYYLYKNIIAYLNKGLNHNTSNTALHILMVTTIIFELASKLSPVLEKKMEEAEPDPLLLVASVVMIAAVIMNFIYLFKVGKKLSVIKNKIASKISKFAYATLISYVVSFALTVITGSNLLESIVLALPLFYLIIDFKESKKELT
jgi:hypothetical protein